MNFPSYSQLNVDASAHLDSSRPAEEARKAAEADPKQQVVVPTPEALAQWEKMTAPVSADWVKNTPGGDKVLTAFHTYLAQVKEGKEAAFY